MENNANLEKANILSNESLLEPNLFNDLLDDNGFLKLDTIIVDENTKLLDEQQLYNQSFFDQNNDLPDGVFDDNGFLKLDTLIVDSGLSSDSLTKIFNPNELFNLDYLKNHSGISNDILVDIFQGSELFKDSDFIAKISSPVEPVPSLITLEVRSLDGSGNNTSNPDWGKAGNIYRRVVESANYVGDGEMVELPNARFISNRVFNDLHINLFSENRTTHWGFTWGQFLDHTFGLAKGGGEAANIYFNSSDPLEDFDNDLGVISFRRSVDANAEVENAQREQINTVSSFIDGWAIYGGINKETGFADRLEWLREGPVDGDLSNNSAKLLLVDGYLPRVDARGDATKAPTMDLMGRLRFDPTSAIVAGDVRANENTGLTVLKQF